MSTLCHPISFEQKYTTHLLLLQGEDKEMTSNHQYDSSYQHGKIHNPPPIMEPT